MQHPACEIPRIHILVLRSSKAVNKNAPPMSGRLGRSSPYSRLRFAVQLPGGDPPRLVDLVAVGEVHPGQSLSAE